MKFSELVRLLERNGFGLVRQNGFGLVRKGLTMRDLIHPILFQMDRLIRVDYHGSREVPTGTLNAILKAAGLRERSEG